VDSRTFVKSRVMQRTKVLLGEGLFDQRRRVPHAAAPLVQPAFHHQRIAVYPLDRGASRARFWTTKDNGSIQVDDSHIVNVPDVVFEHGNHLERASVVVGRDYTDASV